MNVPDVMKGVQLTGHGGPERLVWNDTIPVPRCGADDVLVRVRAAGVNNTDINTRIGWYSREIREGTDAAGERGDIEDGGWSGALAFPRIQGADLCGEVVAVGDRAGKVKPGMRVTCPTNQPEPRPGAPTAFRAIGSEFDGAFAQYCLVPARQVHDVTGSPLSDVEIGAMPCAFGTAYNLLSRAGVGGDDRVLITGASGGVGLAAVTLARLKGAHVIAQAAAGKHDVVRGAGAHELLGRGELPDPASVSVAIDVVGGSAFSGVLDALVPGGRYATSGAIAGPVVEADLRTIYLHDLTIFGCTYTPHDTFAELVELINAGEVRPVISKVYPLADIVRAQEDFVAKTYPGKLVLVPPED